MAFDEESSVVFVVGGLYGNVEALAAVETRVIEESHSSPLVIFNGDFNFLNVQPSDFAKINRTIMAKYKAIAGNVEVEAVNTSMNESSCGCAYPMYVGDDVVNRSNSIVQRLRDEAALLPQHSDIVTWLRQLPYYMGVRVGGLRIGVIHGDPNTLAGWAFSVEAMEPADQQLRQALGCNLEPTFMPTTEPTVQNFFREANVDVFACTHTCLPFAQTFRRCDRHDTVSAIINNGSAGMPNTAGSSFGIMTRIADTRVDPHPPRDSLYGAYIGGGADHACRQLRIDAIPIHYDHAAWMQRFVQSWPEASAAHVSYYNRMSCGPSAFQLHQAARGTFELSN